MRKKSGICLCIVCASTLLRPREIPLFSDMVADHWCLSLKEDGLLKIEDAAQSCMDIISTILVGGLKGTKKQHSRQMSHYIQN